MRLPDDKTKFSHKWKYYEAGVFMVIEEKPQVVRQGKTIKNEEGKKVGYETYFYTTEQLEALAKRKKYTGLYTSVYAYDKPDIETATRFAPLFFDIDNKDLERSLDDARKLLSYFQEFMTDDAIRVYFSGSKGFHIEIEPLAMGIAPSNDLKRIFRRIAEYLRDELDLPSLDFAVYDDRRMWRMPNTIHQNTGLYKREIPKTIIHSDSAVAFIRQAARTPNLDFEVPEQRLNPRAAAWYRKFVYEIEKEEQDANLSLHDRFQLLNKQGSKVIHKFNRDEVDFDPLRGLKECPSIMRLWEKAEKTHDLDHEERLFLCSLLTYNQEAIDYLYAILANCSDFDYERSRHHIEDWIARREAGIGGRPYTCKTANEKGVGCGDCDLEPRLKYATVGDAVVETGEYAEPSPVRLLYKRRR